MAEALMTDDGAGTRSCPLAGDPIEVAVAALPADISSYARKHTRYAVDWAGTLEMEGVVTAVRVRDLSESGAAVETSLRLRGGDTGILYLDQIAGQPRVPVVVKNVVPTSNRVGFGFAEKGRVTARLVAAARAATETTSQQ
jgi:hypothetical protein